MRGVRVGAAFGCVLGFVATVATSVRAEEASTPTLPPEHRVEFALSEDTSVHVVGPSPERREVTCTGPCAKTLPEGVYTLSVRRGDQPWSEQHLYVWDAQRVRVRPPNRGAHDAGKVMAITFGTLFGLSALVFTPAFAVAVYHLPCGYGGGCTPPEWMRPALVVGGIGMAVTVVPMTAGFIMMKANRNPSVHTEPLRMDGAMRTPRRAATPEPVGLAVRFAF